MKGDLMGEVKELTSQGAASEQEKKKKSLESDVGATREPWVLCKPSCRLQPRVAPPLALFALS